MNVWLERQVALEHNKEELKKMLELVRLFETVSNHLQIEPTIDNLDKLLKKVIDSK